MLKSLHLPGNGKDIDRSKLFFVFRKLSYMLNNFMKVHAQEKKNENKTNQNKTNKTKSTCNVELV